MVLWEVALGLEIGQYISDLVITNPPSNDQMTQGDDHIRLIKTVLKNTFPQANRPIFFAAVQTKTANYTLLQSDMSNTFLIDTTGGAVTLTLPALLITDAGWECYIVKINNTTAPVFIAPPTGTIQSGGIIGLAKTRRCIPGVRTRVFWTGSNWFAERPSGAPVGTIIDFDGTALPIGFEWPNGQTLSSSANYPDYFAVKGSGATRDLRGLNTIGKDDMGGTAAGRITVANAGIDGTVLGAAGGSPSQSLTIAQMPLHDHGAATGTDTPDHAHGYNLAASSGAQKPASGGTAPFDTYTGSSTGGATARHTHSIAAQGGGALVNTMPPGMIMSKILVVE